MPDPFDLSQYVTSFNKESQLTPRVFQFADFDSIFSQIAESIRMRQSGVSIGFSIPENAFLNIDAYDTTSPVGLSDSIERFQDAIKEFVTGSLVEEYGKLPNCNIYVGFFVYENGLPIIGVSNIVPNGISFTAPPDATVVDNIIDFAKEIGSRINELIYALNILRNTHAKMYFPYPLNTDCVFGHTSSEPSSSVPSSSVPASSVPTSSVPASSEPLFSPNMLVERYYYDWTINQNLIPPAGDPSWVKRANSINNVEVTMLVPFINGFAYIIFNNSPEWANLPSWYRCGGELDCSLFLGSYIWRLDITNKGEGDLIIDKIYSNNSSTWFDTVYIIGGVGVSVNPADLAIHNITLKFNQTLTLIIKSQYSKGYSGGPVTETGSWFDITGAHLNNGARQKIVIISNDPSVPTHNALIKFMFLTCTGGDSFATCTTDTGGGPFPSGYVSPPASQPASSPPASQPASSPPASSASSSSHVTFPVGRSGCFINGSMVMLADGSEIPIENIKFGDEVLSYNIPFLKEKFFDWESQDRIGHSFEKGIVSGIHRGSEDHYYLINNKIKATFEHPFLVKDRFVWRYLPSKQLKIGYVMLNHKGEEVKIDSIEIINGMIATFNLKIEKYNNFIVEGFVVHNLNDTGPATKAIPPTTDPLRPTGSGSLGGFTELL